MIVPTYETTAKEQEIIINNQRKEIERLNNIIEEVRKYIESNPLVYMYDTDVYVTDIEFLEGQIPELKFFRTLNEILDKADKGE